MRFSSRGIRGGSYAMDMQQGLENESRPQHENLYCPRWINMEQCACAPQPTLLKATPWARLNPHDQRCWRYYWGIRKNKGKPGGNQGGEGKAGGDKKGTLSQLRMRWKQFQKLVLPYKSNSTRMYCARVFPICYGSNV